MVRMNSAKPLGDERLNWLTQELFARISKHELCLAIDERDLSKIIHSKYRIRRELDESAELARLSFLLGKAGGGAVIDRAPVARAAGKTEARLEERNEEKMGGLLENQRRPL